VTSIFENEWQKEKFSQTITQKPELNSGLEGTDDLKVESMSVLKITLGHNQTHDFLVS
jgi:hypothetical protein